MCRFLVIIAVAIVVVSCGGKQQQGKNNASQRATPQVDCHVAKLSDVEISENYAGVLLPFEEVVLRPEVSGRVVQLNFTEGAPVAKGQLLVKVNDDDLRAQLEKNHIQLQLAKDDEARKRELLAIKGISKEEYDKALASLNALTADAAYINAAIAKTEVRAPFAGTVGLRQISFGAFVNNATEIGVLRQTNPLKLEFSVPEKTAAILQKGMTVAFSYAGTDKAIEAQIYALESGIDLATRTLKVRAKVDNANGRLLPGAFATVQVPFSQTGQAVMVPAQAVVPVMEGESVWVLRNGKAVQQKIKTGFRTTTQVMVNTGVEAGDTLIMTGFMQLREGMAVEARVGEERQK